MIRKRSHTNGQSDPPHSVVLVLYLQFLGLFAQCIGANGGILGLRFGQDNAELFATIAADEIFHSEELAKQI